MKKYPLKDRIIKKIEGHLGSWLGDRRKKKINNFDFTIISNNCWGGVIYEHYNLPKMSPTCGAYFFPDDYIKLVKNLRYYMAQKLQIITFKESKYRDELIKRNQTDVPIGRLDDVEIVFLHYKNPEVARTKWETRVGRINWENIILKFSYMNGSTDEHLKQFEEITGAKKVVFVCKKYPEYDDCIIIPGGEDGQIENDSFYYDKYIDIDALINAPITRYPY